MINVLITCGGGFQGLTVYKSLASIDGACIHLADINDDNVCRYFVDYFTVSPLVKNGSDYEEFLYTYCRNHKINLIVPATTYDQEILSRNKLKFKNKLNTDIATPTLEYNRLFADKKRTYEKLALKGIPVQLPRATDDRESYPLIGKPVHGSGSKGLRICKTYLDFRDEYTHDLDEYYWCDYLEAFDEYSIDFSVDFSGSISPFIIRKRIAVSGGFAVIAEHTPTYNTTFAAIADKIAAFFAHPDLSGIYNVQFIVKGDSVFVTDVNPRIGTSAVMGDQAGVNLIAHLLKAMTNVRVTSTSESHLKTVRFLDELHIRNVDTSAIKALVFDLDDTLISNKQFILDRCKILFDKCPYYFNTSFAAFRMQVASLLNEGRAPSLIDELCHIYRIEDKEKVLAEYRMSFPDTLHIYADVEICLRKLHDMGYKLFILTDNPLKTQEQKIRCLPLVNLIDKVYYTDLLKSAKPDAQCFLQIAREYGLAPEEIAMIGDNQYRDIYGALAAGYGLAFHIQRDNGMISQMHNTLDGLVDASKVISVRNLGQMFYYFSNPGK